MIAQMIDTTNVVPDSLSIPLWADAIRYVRVPNTLINNAPTYAAIYGNNNTVKNICLSTDILWKLSIFLWTGSVYIRIRKPTE